MKVLSLNREQTESFGHVALNVDQIPSDEILQAAKYGNLKIYSADGAIHIKSPSSATIENKHLIEILELIERCENEAIAKQNRKLEQHKQMVETIAKMLKLPLD